MPRRLITSAIFLNEKFGNLEDAGRLLFIGCFANADDDGRLKASPKYLKALIFPYDNDKTPEIIEGLRDKCCDLGLIYVYNCNGSEYLYCIGWDEHQVIRKDRYQPSKLPPPNTLMSTTAQPDDNQVSTTAQPDDNPNPIQSNPIQSINKNNIIGQIFKTFDDNIQRITENTREVLNDYIETYGEDEVLTALNKAIKQNKRSLAYVEGILKGGKNGTHKQKPGEKQYGYYKGQKISD